MDEQKTRGLHGAARAFAVTYLAVQTLGILGFWGGLLLVPGVRAEFVPRDFADSMMSALKVLLVADGVFLSLSGAVAAWGVARYRSWATAALWLHAGACLYAGCVAIGLWIVDARMWLGVGMMLPVMTAPLAIAMAASRGMSSERQAEWWVACKTGLQIAVFWGLLLVILPWAIVLVERACGTPVCGSAEELRRWTAVTVFAMCSVFGLWSAWTMVMRGRGTPLPIDPPQELVVSGPYGIVRNPMAMSGLGQGLAVATWFGSPMVAGYVLVGALIWNFGIRPLEEKELLERYGEGYRGYCARVKCWWPRWRGGFMAECDG